MIKVLLIDDDARLHSLMRHIAEEHGWNLVGVRSGQEGLDALARERSDVVILDIMMPRMNGFEVCRRIRQVNETVPVLFLSAKQDIVDKSIGFGAGADDFIVKPFDPDELALRVEAHCRRRKSLADGAPSQRTGTMTVGDLEFSFDSYEVRKRGKVVPLTSKEYEIVGLLASNPGKVFTREQIYAYIWGERPEAASASITVFMRKIREKLEDNPSEPYYIKTVWRIGYKFRGEND